MKDKLYNFDGADYQPERDQDRLSKGFERVREFMEGKPPMSVEEIMFGAGMKSATSTSSMIRNLRKKKFGSRTVERTYVSNGLYKYQLLSEDKSND